VKNNQSDVPGSVHNARDHRTSGDPAAVEYLSARKKLVPERWGMTTTTSDSSELITLAMQGCQALAAAGQDDMVWGHPSVRDPAGRGIWMKGSGWGFEEIDADKIVLVTPDGNVLAGTERRHIEYPIHTEIMARRPEIGAVVHTHSEAANAFSALDTPLRPVSHAGSLFRGEDVPRFTRTGGLIKTHELGVALADALGDAPACLMPQHGLVAVGKDLPTAVMTAILLDKACHAQLAAMSAGEVVRWGSTEDTITKCADVWSDQQLTAGWNYLLRKYARAN
jgi:L-fuculose-phosphate aldolase